MKKLKHAMMITDALGNLSPDSGASKDYNKGLVVGLVAGLMATGLDFTAALKYVTGHQPQGIDLRAFLPENWR
jgi:hypothetical protein